MCGLDQGDGGGGAVNGVGTDAPQKVRLAKDSPWMAGVCSRKVTVVICSGQLRRAGAPGN